MNRDSDIGPILNTDETEYVLTPPYYRSEWHLIPFVAAKLDETDIPFSTLVLLALKEPKGLMSGNVAPAPSWYIGLTREFKKQVDSIDRKLQGRILQALAEITDAPLTMRGDTVKPLTKEERFERCWRYRVGDYRIIYYPDPSERKITFIAFESRADAY